MFRNIIVSVQLKTNEETLLDQGHLVKHRSLLFGHLEYPVFRTLDEFHLDKKSTHQNYPYTY